MHITHKTRVRAYVGKRMLLNNAKLNTKLYGEGKGKFHSNTFRARYVKLLLNLERLYTRRRFDLQTNVVQHNKSPYTHVSTVSRGSVFHGYKIHI